MARIRTIKPEFWTSAQVIECSPMTRLLFVGLWNFCDDRGRHPASAKQCKAEVFPADDISTDDVRRMIEELAANGLIRLYSVDGVEYLLVTGWHHQRIDKPQQARYPDPDGDPSPNVRRMVPPDRKGKEGKGKEQSGAEQETRTGVPSPDGAGAAGVPPPATARRTAATSGSAALRLVVADEEPDAAVATAPPDFCAVGERVIELIGLDAARWAGNFGEVQAWLNAGFDVDRDILPAVRDVAERKRRTGATDWPPRSLRYLTPAIREWHARRVATATASPAGPAPPVGPTRDYAWWAFLVKCFLDTYDWPPGLGPRPQRAGAQLGGCRVPSDVLAAFGLEQGNGAAPIGGGPA